MLCVVDNIGYGWFTQVISDYCGFFGWLLHTKLGRPTTSFGSSHRNSTCREFRAAITVAGNTFRLRANTFEPTHAIPPKLHWRHL